MKSCEEHVGKNSDYYVYTPSKTAYELFLYPMQCGHFIYEAGYYLSRSSFDSFLLVYVEKGSMMLELPDKHFQINAGQFFLLDCYQSHTYFTDTGCECMWCHYDGSLARPYYQNVVAHLGNVFSLMNSYPAQQKLNTIYTTFQTGGPVREALMSKYFVDIMTLFLLDTPHTTGYLHYATMSENIISYINEHFAENISVDTLAGLAGLSQYHFIRTFKKETGFTPHKYILNSRISAAKYLLKNTNLCVKDICFQTGFSCESVFCSAFKKEQGLSPTEYRFISSAHSH